MSLNEEQKKWVDSVALWLQRQLDSPSSEIELRFGCYLNAETETKRMLGAFVSGVGVASWQRVRCLLANSVPESQSCPAQSMLEIVSIYENGSNQSIRQIEHADGTTTTQQKSAVAQRNFIFREPHSNQLVCARLSHSKETLLNDDTNVGAGDVPSLIRVRARTSFWFRMWRIDLSLVQQGVDREAASKAPAIYEIELELQPQRIDWSKHDYHYLAMSLFLRIQEISMAIVETDASTVGAARLLPTIVYAD